MTTFPISNDLDWHRLRSSHVGGSDAAVVLGISKRRTRWQMFMEKTGQLPPIELDDIKYVRNGKLFEAAIADMGKDLFGVNVRKVRRYIESDDCPALGVTCDYEEIGGGKLCPVEIKWSEVGSGWAWEGNTITEAPDDNIIQLQAQLACMPSAPYGRLWAFTQGDVREMVVERRPKLIEAIKEAATSFMADVADRKEPPVDYGMDGDELGRLALARGLVEVDWSADEEGAALIALYRTNQKLEVEVKAAKEEARARILHRLIAAAGANDTIEKSVVQAGGLRCTVSKVADSVGRLIEEKDIGTYVGARNGYYRLSISEAKGK